MRFLVAAFAALSLVPALPVRASDPASAGPVLTLDAAFDRTIAAHPDLRVFEPRRAALDAERERAAQRPAWTAGAELENAFGSGEARGLRSAELTLSLAGVLERGGKRAAREALAQRRIDAFGIEREARRLDLLAETARRYLAVVAARQQGDIAREDIAQRERAVDAAGRRLDAGASPASPVEVPVVAAAKSVDHGMPNRTSLPSIDPSGPEAAAASAHVVRAMLPSSRVPMTPTATAPWRRSPTMRPKV